SRSVPRAPNRQAPRWEPSSVLRRLPNLSNPCARRAPEIAARVRLARHRRRRARKRRRWRSVMHRVIARTYVGQPNETATLRTQVGAGGQISVTLDGQVIGGNTQFSLPVTPRTHSSLKI